MRDTRITSIDEYRHRRAARAWQRLANQHRNQAGIRPMGQHDTGATGIRIPEPRPEPDVTPRHIETDPGPLRAPMFPDLNVPPPKKKDKPS